MRTTIEKPSNYENKDARLHTIKSEVSTFTSQWTNRNRDYINISKQIIGSSRYVRRILWEAVYSYEKMDLDKSEAHLSIEARTAFELAERYRRSANKHIVGNAEFTDPSSVKDDYFSDIIISLIYEAKALDTPLSNLYAKQLEEFILERAHAAMSHLPISLRPKFFPPSATSRPPNASRFRSRYKRKNKKPLSVSVLAFMIYSAILTEGASSVQSGIAAGRLSKDSLNRYERLQYPDKVPMGIAFHNTMLPVWLSWRVEWECAKPLEERHRVYSQPDLCRNNIGHGIQKQSANTLKVFGFSENAAHDFGRSVRLALVVVSFPVKLIVGTVTAFFSHHMRG